MKILLSMIFWLILSVASYGQNVAFLPGDSVFVFRLDDTNSKQSSENGEMRFKYSFPDGYEHTFSGFAGAVDIRVEGFSNEGRALLRTLYTELRKIHPRLTSESYKSEPVEVNGFYVAVVNRNCEAQQEVFQFNKYNERWMRLQVKGGNRDSTNVGKYIGYYTCANAVIYDWRYAESVAQLQYSNRDSSKWSEVGERNEFCVDVLYEDVKFCVYESIPSDGKATRSFELSEDGFKYVVWRGFSRTVRDLNVDNDFPLDHAISLDGPD